MKNSILPEFEDRIIRFFENRGDKIYYLYNGVRQNKNIFEIYSAYGNITLYVKESADEGFWGLNPKYVEEIEGTGATWFLVLLEGSVENGYLLSGKTVRRFIEENRWSSAKTGTRDYKIHDKEKELPKVYYFNDFKELMLRII